MTKAPGSPGSGDEAEPNVADLMNAFSFDSGRSSRRKGRRSRREAEPDTPATSDDGDAATKAVPEETPSERSFDTELEDPSTLVRPYTWTGGRTRSTVGLDLDLETLVSSRPAPDGSKPTQLEHRSIAALCHHPHSVAEVAAKLGVPLGVARVLLSDMVDLGFVVVHKTIGGDDRAAHFNLMERVLSGLRRL
jgi:hypothetical protein